jgi:hypothetical protein
MHSSRFCKYSLTHGDGVLVGIALDIKVVRLGAAFVNFLSPIDRLLVGV